jgi:predicted CoA-binding protein
VESRDVSDVYQSVSSVPIGVDIWVVYSRPKDLPHVPVVVRRQIALEGNRIWVDPTAYGFEELEKARMWLAQRGLTRLNRHDTDQPHIIETWL